MKESGRITDCQTVTISKDRDIELGVGDRIVTTAVSRVTVRVGDKTTATKLSNGLGGAILEIKPNGLAMVQFDTMDKPMAVWCGSEKGQLSNVDHYFAGTTYKSQGETLARNFVYYTPSAARAPGGMLINLSRHKERVDVFASREDVLDWRDMARQMGRATHKTAAIGLGEAAERHACKPYECLSTKAVDQLAAVKKQEVAEAPASVPTLVPAMPRQQQIGALTDLRKAYKQQVDAEYAQRHGAWAQQVADFKRDRDAEIAAFRETVKAEKSGLRADPHLTQDKAALRALMLSRSQFDWKPREEAMRDRHRDQAAAIGVAPRKQTFEEFLDQQIKVDRSPAAIAAKSFLEQRHGVREQPIKIEPEMLIDLNQMLADHGYKRVSEDRPNRTENWTKDSQTISVRQDLDGKGCAFVSINHPNQINGGAEQLAKHLAAPLDPYLAQAKQSVAAAESVQGKDAVLDHYEMRTLDQTAARQRWEISTPVTPNNRTITALDLDLGSVQRMGARQDLRGNILIPQLDPNRNITGFDILSPRFETKTRNSNRGQVSVMGDIEAAPRIYIVEDNQTAFRLADLDHGSAFIVVGKGGLTENREQDLKDRLADLNPRQTVALAVEPTQDATRRQVQDEIKSVIAEAKGVPVNDVAMRTPEHGLATFRGEKEQVMVIAEREAEQKLEQEHHFLPPR